MAESNYYIAYLMSTNWELTQRVAASAQQEGVDTDPEQWAKDHKWEWSTQSDWIAAVAAAQETGITEWGRSASVVTDQMILSYVQGAVAP